jgi:hypothetical protein
VDIPISNWLVDREDRFRLKTTLVVNGLPLHLEAIAVRDGEQGLQEANDPSDESLALVHEAVGAHGQWQTLEIDGRDYVLIATPFC